MKFYLDEPDLSRTIRAVAADECLRFFSRFACSRPVRSIAENLLNLARKDNLSIASYIRPWRWGMAAVC